MDLVRDTEQRRLAALERIVTAAENDPARRRLVPLVTGVVALGVLAAILIGALWLLA